MTIASARSARLPWSVILGFIVLNLAAKGAFININTGEYTDGMLQLQSWRTRAGIYPPLYEGLARLVSMLGVSLEQAARIVSLLAASLCVWPVMWLAQRLGGSRSAAIFAAILYTLSPMPWRWSVRVMTDSLYLLLSTGAMVCLAEAWMAIRIQPRNPAPSNSSTAALFLAIATLLAGLAAFTRYQGALLAPLLTLVFVIYILRLRRIPWITSALAIAMAAAAAWWTSVNQQMHTGQFTSRTAGSPLQTLFAWINNLESFALISPYYIGYPVFALALAGLWWTRRSAIPWYPRPAAVLWGLYALMLLVLHSAFGSFQYRYMMPLVPMFCALGGVSLARLEQWAATPQTASRPLIFRAIILITTIYLACFSMAILVLQRETFGDQRAAAEFIHANVPPNVPVFSNERYGPHLHLGSVKLSYWSRRPVQVLVSPDQEMPAGSVLVLGTAYGGDETVGAMLAALTEHYTLEPLTPQPFRSQIIPLMDDIMTNPMFNQNPLAWVLRYAPQHFATQVFLVQPRTGSPSGANNAP